MNYNSPGYGLDDSFANTADLFALVEGDGSTVAVDEGAFVATTILGSVNILPFASGYADATPPGLAGVTAA